MNTTHTNEGCPCIPNSAISYSVTNCAHQNDNRCGLHSIYKPHAAYGKNRPSTAEKPAG